MPVYHFTIKSDWFEKKGYIESSSVYKAKEQIQLKTNIGKNGHIECEKYSDKNKLSPMLQTPMEKFMREFKEEGFTVYHDYSTNNEHIEEDDEDMSVEEEEGFKYLY